MSDNALYYPDWSIRNAQFLCECLLYWDRLACIAPYEGFTFCDWIEDDDMRSAVAEAHEKFVTFSPPSEEQKKRAHEKIKVFAENVAPTKLRPSHVGSNKKYQISIHKLPPETVALLTEHKWMTGDAGNHLRELSEPVVNLIMAALAQECSDANLQPITDDPGGFVASCNVVFNELANNKVLVIDEGSTGSIKDVSYLLEPTSHLGLHQSQGDPRILCKLIAARDKPDIAGLRNKFRETVDEYLPQLQNADGPGRKVLRDHFRDRLDRDLSALKHELGRAGLETVFSKEGIAAIGVGALSGAALSPPVGGIIGLLTGWTGYRKNRKETLDKHWTSWLYATEHVGFSIL